MNELVWFYFTIIINIVIGFATYYASKRDRKKRINAFKKIQDDELERVRKKFNLWFFRGLYLERNIMNEIFNFHGQEVRTLTIDDEPWFVGKDVADILGYAKPLDAISRHVDEDDSVKYGLTDNLGRTQNTIIINESGLYSLILSSKLPQAKEFKRWVTSEVLPAIRKQGGFIREDLDEDAFIALFTGQKKLREQQASMLEDIDYLKSEQPIHPSYAQSLLKKRKARVVACLGGIDSQAYADKIFAQSVFRQAEIDFKDHFNISRYDLLPKKFAEAALAYWMTWEPSTNTKMKIMELNAFSQA